MSNTLANRTTPTDRILGYLCLLIGAVVVVLKLTGMVRWSWLWFWLGPLTFALLSTFAAMVVFIGRAILELSGILKVNVEDWVKIQLERWLEEHSTGPFGDPRREFEISDVELRSVEENIRQDAIESHRRNNWMVVKYFFCLAVFLAIGRSCSHSYSVAMVDQIESQGADEPDVEDS
jgi:hypothetical protein